MLGLRSAAAAPSFDDTRNKKSPLLEHFPSTPEKKQGSFEDVELSWLEHAEVKEYAMLLASFIRMIFMKLPAINSTLRMTKPS